jgi:hypothetical protein
MDPAEQSAIEAAMRAVAGLRATLSKRKKKQQINAKSDKDQVKATAESWFRSQRPFLSSRAAELRVAEVDAKFNKLQDCAERATTRDRYLDMLKSLREELMALRARGLARPAPKLPTILQPPPEFNRLVTDAALRSILERRWKEIQLCIQAGADLSATVMMGGFLEGVFMARILVMPNQAPARTAKASPKDKSGATRPLDQWTLNDYLEVAYELVWIGRPAKKISAELRDYRNLIHPQEEQKQGVSLTSNDSTTFWSVLSAVTSEVVKSI